MTRNQNEELRMMLDITGLIKKNADKMQGRPTLSSLFTTVASNCELVQANFRVQLNDKSAITTEKNAVRSALEAMLKRQIRIAKGFFANKSMPGNEKTAANLYDALYDAQDLEVFTVANTFVEFMTPFANDTLEFGITTESLGRIASLALTFHTLTVSTGNEKSVVVTATNTIDTLLRTNKRIIMRQIDYFFEDFAETDPVFYEEYKRLRKITYYHRHRIATEGDVTPTTASATVKVVDSKTKQGIEGATVSVDGQPLADVTDQDGELELENLSLAQHEIAALADGFAPATLMASTPEAGEEYTFEIELTKL